MSSVALESGVFCSCGSDSHTSGWAIDLGFSGDFLGDIDGHRPGYGDVGLNNGAYELENQIIPIILQ
jgi:hypothetical protein